MISVPIMDPTINSMNMGEVVYQFASINSVVPTFKA